MLVGHNGLVMRQPVTQAKRGGAGPAYVRTRRPGPAPRPGFATGCAALAGLGFGVSVGTVVIGESRGALAAPGGLRAGSLASPARRHTDSNPLTNFVPEPIQG